MRLGQTSAVLTVSRLIGSAVGFLSTVYFARELGESVLGQYALVLALVTWIGIVGESGLSKAITKRLSEGHDSDAFLGAAILVLAMLFSLAAAGVALLAPQINRYVGASVAVFVVLLLFVNLLSTLTNSALQGNHYVHVQGLLSAAERILRAAAQVLLVVVGLQLIGMLSGYVLSGLVAAIVALLYLGLRPSIPDRHHVVSLFDFAKYAWLGNISNRAYNSLDLVVLGWFVAPALIGIYSVAWSIAMFLNIFGRSLEGTLFPEMSKIATSHGVGVTNDLTEEALRYSGLVTIPGLVGSIIIGDRLLLVYGSGFRKGRTILAVLVGAALIYMYMRQLRNTLNAIDRPEMAFRVNGVFTGVNIVLNVALVAAFGWIGAAVATLVSAAAGAAAAYRYVKSVVGIDFPVGAVGRQGIAALVMGIAVLGLRRVGEQYWLPRSNAALVVGVVAAGALIYFVVLAVIWPAFRTTVATNIPTDRFSADSGS